MMRDRILKPISLSLLGKKKTIISSNHEELSLFYRALSFIAKKKTKPRGRTRPIAFGCEDLPKSIWFISKRERAESGIVSLSLSFSCKIWHQERESEEKKTKN